MHVSYTYLYIFHVQSYILNLMDSIIEINNWNNYTAIWALLLTEKKPQVLTDSKFNAVESISDYRGK